VLWSERFASAVAAISAYVVVGAKGFVEGLSKRFSDVLQYKRPRKPCRLEEMKWTEMWAFLRPRCRAVDSRAAHLLSKFASAKVPDLIVMEPGIQMTESSPKPVSSLRKVRRGGLNPSKRPYARMASLNLDEKEEANRISKMVANPIDVD
jgi:hypothetical protein